MSFNLSELMGAFLDEIDEQLHLLDQEILLLEQQGESPEIIQRIFRAAHTLKGSSATMGFEEMKHLTHEMENVLDKIRQRLLPVSAEVVTLLFQCLDSLRTLKDELISGRPYSETQELVAALRRLLQQEQAPETDGPVDADNDDRYLPVALTDEARNQLQEAAQQGSQAWLCRVEIAPGCTMKLARAHLIHNRLREVGTMLDIAPPLEESEGDDAFRFMSFLVLSREDEHRLRTTVEQISDLRSVTVEPFGSPAAAATDAKAAAAPAHSPDEASAESAKPAHDLKRSTQTVRVDVDRLESLMNLVGELVIDQTRILQLGNKLSERYQSDETVGELSEITNHLMRVISDLQEGVMKSRMLPIEQLFNRFPRMVRDLATALNKEVHLQLHGQETELDRSVIEEIGDPLIHLIRNAIDHGIEPTDVRLERGKPAKGTIRLTASHQENQVVLTVEDDGGGMDPQRIKESALLKGMITPQEAEEMAEHQWLSFIFHPGFSTSSTVSDVSGRGVGMDIVRSHIEKLGGMIDVDTEIGVGTTFTIKLPLTLAILTGLMIKLAGRTYALPMNSVVEIVRLPLDAIQTIKGHAVAVIRDKALPLVWLHDHFGFAHQQNSRNNVFLVIVGIAEKRFGLVVDELIGNQEIVVKSLGSFIGKVEGFSGATILGDGSVAPILDVVAVSRISTTHKGE